MSAALRDPASNTEPFASASRSIAVADTFDESVSDSPHQWFIAELVTLRRLNCLYVVWLCLLAVCGLGTALASSQFDCFEFCGFAEQSCSVFGIETSIECINMSSSVWQGSGFSAPFTSKLRRHPRLVIAQPGAINGTFKVGVRIDESSFEGSTFHSVNPDGSFADSWPLVYTAEDDFLTLKLPEGFTMSENATGMALALRQPATFSNATNHNLPLAAFAKSSVVRSGISVVFITLTPWLAVADVIVRYIALLLNILVGLFLVRSYRMSSVMKQNEKLIVSLKAVALDFSGVVGFHAIVCLFCDPLAVLSLFYPGDDFLRYWSDHFVYAFFLSIVMILIFYLCLTLPFVASAKTATFRIIAITLSSVFGVCYFALAAVAASQGSTTTAIVSPENLGTERTATWYGIAGFVIIVVWCISVACMYVLNKDKVVWNKGRRLYFGRMRIRILALRIVASLVAVYALYWLCVYLPLQLRFSAFVPTGQRTGMQDVAVATFVSCLNCCMWMVVRFPPTEAPARAEQINSGDIDEQVKLSLPIWQQLRWTLPSFRFLAAYSPGGYYFLTEEARMKFLVRHRVLGDSQRSFFCLETANSCLSLSNEVYYEAPAASCTMSIAAKESALLRCLGGGCCCCCCAAGAADADDAGDRKEPREAGYDDKRVEASSSSRFTCGPLRTDAQIDEEEDDVPEGFCDERELNVEKHGYKLISSLKIAGVQTVVTGMIGADALRSKYDWGNAEHVPLRGSIFDQHREAYARQEKLQQQTSAGTFDPPSRGTSLDISGGAQQPRANMRMSHIVVAFQGTANSANAATDANIGRAVFEAMSDRRQNYARVHAGFESCWSDLEPAVFEALCSARKSFCAEVKLPEDRVPVVFTGHSLGGALAALAAYSWRRKPDTAGPVMVYTYGMPRVGNSVFVDEYNKFVPESYRVVNENDTVANIGHCTRQHVGRTVVIDRDGNFIVEPNGIEQRHQPLNGGGFSVKNHFLYRYGRALDKIFEAHGSNMKSFLATEPEEPAEQPSPNRSHRRRKSMTTSPSGELQTDGSFVIRDLDKEAAAAEQAGPEAAAEMAAQSQDRRVSPPPPPSTTAPAASSGRMR